MDPLHLAHLVLVSAWGGVVLGETVLELAGGTGEAAERLIARVHLWIDLLVELPIILGVLATGALMTLRAWPIAPLLALKLGAGGVAVALNLYCIGAVVARARATSDDARRRWTRHVRASALGIPFAITAAALGLTYFRR